jgi:hypothetical protein
VLSDPCVPHIAPSRISPPSDLRIPTFRPPPLDVEYADATWQSLHHDNDAARRLGRAIDWLALAWLNATSLTDELRVPALHAGFEVLLNMEDALDLARELGRLLEDESRVRHRTWVSFANNHRSANLAEISWWFMEFSLLRNQLMHGRTPGTEVWAHDERSQVDLGEWYLRQAIKRVVANDGHPDIVETPLFRELVRAAREQFPDPEQQCPGPD